MPSGLPLCMRLVIIWSLSQFDSPRAPWQMSVLVAPPTMNWGSSVSSCNNQSGYPVSKFYCTSLSLSYCAFAVPRPRCEQLALSSNVRWVSSTPPPWFSPQTVPAPWSPGRRALQGTEGPRTGIPTAGTPPSGPGNPVSGIGWLAEASPFLRPSVDPSGSAGTRHLTSCLWGKQLVRFQGFNRPERLKDHWGLVITTTLMLAFSLVSGHHPLEVWHSHLSKIRNEKHRSSDQPVKSDCLLLSPNMLLTKT